MVLELPASAVRLWRASCWLSSYTVRWTKQAVACLWSSRPKPPQMRDASDGLRAGTMAHTIRGL